MGEKPTSTRYTVERLTTYRVVKSESGPTECGEGHLSESQHWSDAVAIAEAMMDRDRSQGIESFVRVCAEFED